MLKIYEYFIKKDNQHTQAIAAYKNSVFVDATIEDDTIKIRMLAEVKEESSDKDFEVREFAVYSQHKTPESLTMRNLKNFHVIDNDTLLLEVVDFTLIKPQLF